MATLFILGVVLNLVVPWVVLWALRRRWEQEPSWWGLVAIGAGAVVVSWLGAMGLWTFYQAVAPLPATMPRRELALRPDFLLFTAVVLGLLIELVKAYGTRMFHSRMVQGNLPLFGVAVGFGAGMVQAFLVLGSTTWAALAGQQAIEAAQVALAVRHASLTAMEVALGALVMYRVAQGKRASGIAIGGLVHGLALAAAAVVQHQDDLGPLALWGGTATFLLVAAGAGGVVWWWVQKKGWPM